MQEPQQVSEQDTKRGNPAWVTGRSQNPRGRLSKAEQRARRDALIAEWTAVIGGPASLLPAELALAQQAAELVMCKPRTAEDRVRCANLVSRILYRLGLVGSRKRDESSELAKLWRAGNPP